jgi:glyoxylase I family protein
MLKLQTVHHIAIICSDYERSKKFYTEILGLEILSEHLRQERNSYKLDLALNGRYIIELFSFNDPPKRVSRPEAAGLRHLAFQVEDLYSSIHFLKTNDIDAEPVRVDDLTGKRFTFFKDPDDLPIELYEN